MAETLKWMRFLPSKGVKVKCIEFHTVHPWLAIADKANNISVWDFESEQVTFAIPYYAQHPNRLGRDHNQPQHDAMATRHSADTSCTPRVCCAQLVYETSLGTPDNEALQDALLQRAAEKDPEYFGPLLSQVRPWHHLRAGEHRWGSLQPMIVIIHVGGCCAASHLLAGVGDPLSIPRSHERHGLGQRQRVSILFASSVVLLPADDECAESQLQRVSPCHEVLRH